MFHWHKWQFVEQADHEESKDQGPHGVAVIRERVNIFRCKRCDKSVWQPAKDPYRAFAYSGKDEAAVRYAYF